MRPYVFLATSLFAALSFVNAAHGQTLANWTFESTSLTSSGTTEAAAGPFLAEGGLQAGTAEASGLHLSATTVYSAPAGNGSPKSFSSNGWALGDYYQFTLSTTSFDNIVVSFDQTSSATGPRDFKLSYSTDGTNFTDFITYSPLVNSSPNAWSASTPAPAAHFSFDLSSISAIDDASQVTFRLVMNSTTSENSGTVAASGTDRVDNFTVASIPEPSATLALLGGAGLLAIRRRRA